MAEAIDSREITLTRIYDAPRELLFSMWTEAEHLARWWGPDGFSVPRVSSDPRPGGALTILMVGPGFEETMRASYREVVAPERIVVDSVVPGPDGLPLIESSHTVTFADLQGRTEVTVRARASVFRPEGLDSLAGMKAGWSQSLQCLDDLLTGAVDRQLLITRIYPAPPELVFPLWIEREHVQEWWGPEGFSITVHQMEVRPGGTWSFTMHGPQGADFPNTIIYDQIDPPQRLVYTHLEPRFQTIVTFDEMKGMTALAMRLVFASSQERDRTVEDFNAREGAEQTLERLSQLLGEPTATRPQPPA